MRLATKYDTPEKFEGRKITDVLCEEGILPAAKATKTIIPELPRRFPKWAVVGPEDEPVADAVDEDASERPPTILMPGRLDKLRYDLDSLPNQVAGLSTTIMAILKHPKQEREAAWPIGRVAVIKTAVQELRAALERLESEMPEVGEVRVGELSVG